MMLENEEVWEIASRQLIRAVRGKRSQVAFSRRLGYRGNVAASWEGGHRAPTAEALVDAMRALSLDVDGGFARFHADSAPAVREGLPAWLRALRGRASQAAIAERAGRSRHQVRRWLTGEARPRVPDFLRLVHALTGRAPDWVACFVDIERVPALAGQYAAARTAARLAFDHPWSAAVRMVIDSDAYRSDPTDGALARILGIPPDVVGEAVDALLAGGLARRQGEALVAESTFTADAQASEADRRRLKAHWARVATARLQHEHPEDLVSLNLAILSKADLDRVRQLQREYFRALRGLVASSEPSETAVLILMHTVSLTGE